MPHVLLKSCPCSAFYTVNNQVVHWHRECALLPFKRIYSIYLFYVLLSA